MKRLGSLLDLQIPAGPAGRLHDQRRQCREQTRKIPSLPGVVPAPKLHDMCAESLLVAGKQRLEIISGRRAQRQILTDAVSRIELEGQSVTDSLAQAQQEEQALLDSYYTE